MVKVAETLGGVKGMVTPRGDHPGLKVVVPTTMVKIDGTHGGAHCGEDDGARSGAHHGW